MKSWKTDVIQMVINMIRYRKFALLLVAIKRRITSKNKGIWFNNRRGDCYVCIVGK